MQREINKYLRTNMQALLTRVCIISGLGTSFIITYLIYCYLTGAVVRGF